MWDLRYELTIQMVPNWLKISVGDSLFLLVTKKIDCITLDPDPNSTYLDPQHC